MGLSSTHLPKQAWSCCGGHEPSLPDGWLHGSTQGLGWGGGGREGGREGGGEGGELCHPIGGPPPQMVFPASVWLV